MAKIYIEIDDPTKQQFSIQCTLYQLTQKEVITELIRKWTRKKRGKK